MEIITIYIISFILFKFIVWLDNKYTVFTEEKPTYSMWAEYQLGRKKIYTIIFLMPWVNIICSVFISVWILILFLYNHTKFSLF